MGSFSTELLEFIYPYFLPAARALGIVALLPGLGSPRVPPLARLVIAGAVSLLVVGSCDAATALPEQPSAYVMMVVSELALGMTIGWGVLVFFESVRWAGEVVDIQIGLRVGQLFDPVRAEATTLLGQLYHLVALTFFFVVDGHHWVLAAIARSFERLPPGSLAFGGPALELLINAAGSALDIGIRISVVGVTALLLADIALAIVGRHVPQMNVFLVGIPGKIGAGLVALAISAPLLGGALGTMVAEIKRLVMALLVG